MKTNLYLLSTKVQRHHIQIAFGILVIVMLVLGAGAPEDGGGITRGLAR